MEKEKLTKALDDARTHLVKFEDAAKEGNKLRGENLDLERRIWQQASVINTSVVFAVANILYYVVWPMI